MTRQAPDAPPRIIVIGGGLAGLVAARAVGRAAPHTQVLLLEGSDRFGGKLKLATVAGCPVDVGAEAMLAARPEGVALVTDLGAGGDLVAPRSTAASIWSRGALHPIPRATLMGVPGDPDGLEGLLTGPELARLADERAWPGGVVTGDVSVGAYVAARLGRAVVDRLVEPLLGGVYAGRADDLSLQATMPGVWQVALAGESLTEAARRSATPPGRPARPVFAGIRGGLGRLPGLLLADLPAQVTTRSGALVRALERTGHGFTVLAGPTTDEQVLTADAVILATPPVAAARLLAGVAPEASTALGEIPVASSAVVTMAFPRHGMPGLAGSGFLVPPVDGHLVKGATFSTGKWGWTAALDPDLVLLRASIGRTGEEHLLHRGDEELIDACVAELGLAVGGPLPALVEGHVQRWGGGLPQYTVGHVPRMDRVLAAVARVPGLEVAGAAYRGVGIPAVIASGQAAAAAVLTHLGVPPAAQAQ